MSATMIPPPAKKPKTGTKGQKKTIINESIFGKSLDKSDPEEGITGVTIQADEIGNIPGSVEHWWHDLDLRKQDIVAYADRTFVQRAVAILKKDPLAAGTNGYELAKYHPLKKYEPLVKDLKLDPKNALARLQLVSTIGQADRTFPIEFYRTLLLQAIVACSFGEVSFQGLQIAIWAQNTYLQKLNTLCKDYQDKLKTNLNSIKSGEHSFRQRLPIETKIKEVQRNINILQAYQTHANKFQPEPSSANWTVSLDEVQNIYLSSTPEKKDKKEKALITKKIAGMIDIIRYILLLHPFAHEMIDLFIKLENKNPLGHFLKARVCMSAMVFSVGQYEGGERNAKTKQDVQDNFKAAYHQYGLAIKKMGKVPKGTTHFSILIEYANIILYFYQIATHLLKIKLPSPWVQTSMQRANKALVMAETSGKIENLQELLLKIVEAEKLETEKVLAYS